MKKPLIRGFLIFLLITNIIFVGTTVLYKTKIDKQVIKVYSFDGEGTDIRISNGIIIISPNKQTVSGGKIQYIGNKQENLQSYTKTIYLNKQMVKDKVLSNSASGVGGDKGISFADEFMLNKYIGEISSEKLFSEDDIGIINDNLYFSLDYSTVDGQKGNSTVKLKVKEYNMNEIK
ncbi:hypothetical protein KPL47_24075 [Clostridium estertheticum]|uniref:hypothetical protein n=1 Tax=Clostridium estertheticum TaxID=238834 RepID=UPI001C0BF154|nr:hypothetical protein [Clostridium estertheticum]MBU3179367.1 hypothetical protein [Clostridium estertheticum]